MRGSTWFGVKLIGCCGSWISDLTTWRAPPEPKPQSVSGKLLSSRAGTGGGGVRGIQGGGGGDGGNLTGSVWEQGSGHFWAKIAQRKAASSPGVNHVRPLAWDGSQESESA